VHWKQWKILDRDSSDRRRSEEAKCVSCYNWPDHQIHNLLLFVTLTSRYVIYVLSTPHTSSSTIQTQIISRILTLSTSQFYEFKYSVTLMNPYYLIVPFWNISYNLDVKACSFNWQAYISMERITTGFYPWRRLICASLSVFLYFSFLLFSLFTSGPLQIPIFFSIYCILYCLR
jgi:hypothetical protein